MKKVFILGSEEILVNYAQALSHCGAVGIFSQDLTGSEECGGLLLPGGGDINPAVYGEPNTASYQVDDRRDQLETELIEEFVRTGRPILGICRGCQIVNTAYGGSMIQELPTAALHRWEESTGDKAHFVTVSEDSFLFPLYGSRFMVNSAHHQAAGRIGAGLEVTAESDDGVVEALESPSKKIYTMQWHPERMAFEHRKKELVDGRLVFEYFLQLC